MSRVRRVGVESLGQSLREGVAGVEIWEVSAWFAGGWETSRWRRVGVESLEQGREGERFLQEGER